MGQHDAYGKLVIERAAGSHFDESRAACRVDFGGAEHTGGFIDGTACGTIAIEVESRTAKQVRGAVLDLICHRFPKKLLLIIRMYSGDLAAEQCSNALARFVRCEDYRVLLLSGTGDMPSMDEDIVTVRAALVELGMPEL